MRRKKSEEQRRLERLAAQAHRYLEQNAPLTPCYASVLVGREAELEQIRQWHENPQARWLTLTGPSGIGKTHLACEFLQRARSWGWLSVYVNLTAEDEPRQILVALFHALNLPFPEDESWKTILAQVFRRPALIVLDDFSKLLESQPRAGVVVLLQRAGSRSSFTSVAQVVQAILEVAPQVKVLATSQRPLELPIEQTLPLRLLPTPPDDWSGRTLDELRAYPSAAVLLNQITDLTRLSRVPPAELAALCRELQGHPGRLVNAGLYLNACPWSRFSQQYRRSLALQESESARSHPTPIAKNSQMFQSLLSEEQRALQCLSLFPDAFDLPAAAAVMQKTPELGRRLLQDLEARGFVQSIPSVPEPRFRLTRIREAIPPLTEALRRVVLQRLHAHYLRELQSPLTASVADLRFHYFVERENLTLVLDGLAQQGDASAIAQFLDLLIRRCALRPPASLLDWGMNYVARTDDLSVEERARIALPVLLGLNSHGGGGRPDERMLQLTRILENSPDAAVYLGRFWHNRAHGDRAREHYQIAYTHALLLNDHARAVEAAAWLAESEAVIGNLRTAEQILKDLEQHYLPARLPRSIRRTYYYVYGYYHYQRGRFRRSRELYLKALDNSDRCPDVLRELSRVELEFGNYQYAYRLAEEALNQLMLDKTEPHEASIHALKGCLGDLCAVMERYDDALVYHAPCLDFWQAIEQPRWICWTLNRLVEIELLARDARRSWRLHHSFGRSAGELLHEAWEVIQPTYMNLPHKARTLHNLGWLAWHEGRLDAAEYYLEQALTMRQQYGAEYGVARTQETLARVRVAQGRPREARALFEAAAQFRARGRTRLYPQIRSCNRAIQNRLR